MHFLETGKFVTRERLIEMINDVSSTKKTVFSEPAGQKESKANQKIGDDASPAKSRPWQFTITWEDYLMGIADTTGELMRLATTYAGDRFILCSCI